LRSSAEKKWQETYMLRNINFLTLDPQIKLATIPTVRVIATFVAEYSPLLLLY